MAFRSRSIIRIFIEEGFRIVPKKERIDLAPLADKTSIATDYYPCKLPQLLCHHQTLRVQVLNSRWLRPLSDQCRYSKIINSQRRLW